LRAIKRGSAGDNYRFESLIQQIVMSVPFTERMSVDMSNNLAQLKPEPGKR
jgi:hypothetical protein